MKCPNCGSEMNEGDLCPECEHVDGDFNCECNSCNPDDDGDGDCNE